MQWEGGGRRLRRALRGVGTSSLLIVPVHQQYGDFKSGRMAPHYFYRLPLTQTCLITFQSAVNPFNLKPVPNGQSLKLSQVSSVLRIRLASGAICRCACDALACESIRLFKPPEKEVTTGNTSVLPGERCVGKNDRNLLKSALK